MNLSDWEDVRVNGNDWVERVRKEELQCLRSFDLILWGNLKASCPQSNASRIQVIGAECWEGSEMEAEPSAVKFCKGPGLN